MAPAGAKATDWRLRRHADGCLEGAGRYNGCRTDAPMVEPTIHGSWFHTHAKEFMFFVGLATGFLMGWITHVAFGKRGAERKIH